VILKNRNGDEWRQRILCIPDWLIEDACNFVIGLGINRAEANAAKDFLKSRRDNFRSIVKSQGRGIHILDAWNPPNVLFDK
jgi:hypothetical protein